MKLKNEKYEEIKELVSNIIEDYHVIYPLDIYELVEKMEFGLLPYSFYSDNRSLLEAFSKDGFSKYFSEGKTHIIYYNDNVTPEERISLTIAHELGHILMECDHDEEGEAIANYFACYLLAPTILVIENKLATIDEIKQFFKISYICAKYTQNRAVCRVTHSTEIYEYENRIIETQKNHCCNNDFDDEDNDSKCGLL